ncbi:ABC transporter substrate-binding protein [Pseudonocardia sp. WMMC193]|uniref:ABC transporter substrate-binding protein n=1 Tax=Pseudonocardia sp. WMMC193 TaxID=2911965 RepID=UPI001F302E1D|nr:ABC transporter substrate-binding protein [Pseudonocardia sp. WMMC193]MCF7549154.1 ABC transporter substrate-binding protein [Pseudonocardia sp. WMMC193]
MRIASLLPAATEITLRLGLRESLAAVTFECPAPGVPVVVDTAIPPGLAPAEIDAWVGERAAAGLPLYELDRAALREIDPDLILTQDLCRVCALPAGTVEEALAEIGSAATVVSVDPHTLDDVLAAIADVGAAAGAHHAASQLVRDLTERLAAVAAAVADAPRPRVLVLEWTDPAYVPGHWVPELVRRAGGEPLAGVEGGRSVAAEWSALQAQAPDVVVVAPCGFGLDDAVAQAGPVRDRFPGVPVVAIDSAELVVKAGPGLVDGIEALAWALHPARVPEPPAGRIIRT